MSCHDTGQQSKEQALDSMEMPARDTEECANSPQCEAGEACCYGLGHFQAFSRSVTHTQTLIKQQIPKGKQLTWAKEPFSFTHVVN